MGPSPLGFLANPQLSTDLVCLYQLPFELGQPYYSPKYDELSKTYIGLKSQHFLYLQPSEHQMSIDKLEKSNEAKIEVSHFVSSFNIYIIHHDVTSIRSTRHRLTRTRSSEGRKKLFFGTFPNILDPRSFDQRCSINLIRRRMLSRIVFL